MAWMLRWLSWRCASCAPRPIAPPLITLQVWFLGKADVQKIRGNPHLAKTNFGYDDERGDYVVTASDHIAYRYEVQGVLGKGSFGQVLKVLDYKTGTFKALKIIRNKKRFHHQVSVCVRAEAASSACMRTRTRARARVGSSSWRQHKTPCAAEACSDRHTARVRTAPPLS
jgi:hypothetical protein